MMLKPNMSGEVIVNEPDVFERLQYDAIEREDRCQMVVSTYAKDQQHLYSIDRHQRKNSPVDVQQIFSTNNTQLIPNLADISGSCSESCSSSSEVASVNELKHMMSSDGPTPIGIFDEISGQIVSANKFIRTKKQGSE